MVWNVSVSDPESEPWQAAEARTLVTYPMDGLDGWDITFAATDDSTIEEGSTSLQQRRIVVSVPPTWSPERAANALAHELGHVHDALFLNPKLRGTYLRRRGVPRLDRLIRIRWTSFRMDRPRRRQRAGCEDFAEVFAMRWGPPAEFVSTVQRQPNTEEMAALEQFLAPRMRRS